jgi:hypothetical protein
MLRSRSVPSAPTAWIKPAVTFMMFPFSGTFDAASGRVKGTIQAPGCTGFDAARDEQASRRLEAAAAAREAEFANAPTALAAARNPAEKCLVIAKWYARFKKEYPAVDILRSMADDLYANAINLFMDEEFSPVFGIPFDRMADAERQPIMMTIRECASSLGDRGDLFMYQRTRCSGRCAARFSPPTSSHSLPTGERCASSGSSC